MKMYPKYAPYIILIAFLLLFFPYDKPVNYEWIGLVALFIAIIFLFEFIEKSRKSRIAKWLKMEKRPNRIYYISTYSFLFGLPISLIISLLIYDKSTLLHLLIFILFPLIIIFGWIGYLDWQKIYKETLSKKYKNV